MNTQECSIRRDETQLEDSEKKSKSLTEMQVLLRQEYPGVAFTKPALKSAGRALKAGDVEKTKAILALDRERFGGAPGNFKPPAKCNVIKMSRPFHEWPISLASKAVQDYCFSLSEKVYQQLKPGVSKGSHAKWLKTHTVDLNGFHSVGGLNKIFNNVDAIREGVKFKVENRNKKKEERGLELDSAFDEDGKFVQKPGVNSTIYMWSETSPQAFDPSNKRHLAILENVPELKGYALGPDEAIESAVPNRLAIPFGQPGHVPEHQRGFVNRRKGRVRGYGHQPILGVIRVGADWALIDLRGLMRNLRWRFAPLRLTPNKLLSYFTGDPVIDPVTNQVTFSYKDGIVPVRSKKVIGERAAPKTLAALTDKGPVALVSIDLGVINPVAARLSLVTTGLGPQRLDETFLPQWQLDEMENYRVNYDIENARILAAATAALTQEQQDEIAAVTRSTADETKAAVLQATGVTSELPWNLMTSTSQYISNAILADDSITDKSMAWFDGKNKKGEAIRLQKRDSKFAGQFRKRVTRETALALQEQRWEQQKASPKWVKLSKYKEQISRQIVNDVLAWARRLAPGAEVVVNVENLKITFFHGRGERPDGWSGFFHHKKENRWFMQALHKAFTDLPKHRGILVIESPPARTSRTCTQCGYCDKANRNGDYFRCLSCFHEANTDLVAAHNLERIAITGKAMPKPEQLGDAEIAVAARTPRATKTRDNVGADTKKTTPRRKKGRPLETAQATA